MGKLSETVKGKLERLISEVDSLDSAKLGTLDYLVKEVERQVTGKSLEPLEKPQSDLKEESAEKPQIDPKKAPAKK